jgi:hypothetical protein
MTDILPPICSTLPTMLICCPPTLNPPHTDSDEPTRANCLKLQLEPIFRKSITLQAEPNLLNDLTDIDDPKPTCWNTESVLPVFKSFVTLKDWPTVPHSCTDKLKHDPTAARPQIEIPELQRLNARNDSDEPNAKNE